MIEDQDFERWWLAAEPGLVQLAQRFHGVLGRDVVQDVAVIALRTLQKNQCWANEEHFYKWARQRVRWLALDQLRRSKRQSQQPMESIAEPFVIDSQDELVDNRLLEKVRVAITRLPERQRLVMEESIKGVNDSEIAKSLGISEATIRSLRRFARQRIMQQMDVEF